MKSEIMVINGEEWIRKDSVPVAATRQRDGLPYRMIRTRAAGVFAGYVESQSQDGEHIVLRDARRMWFWAGAASLSELATRGTSKPDECKFPCAVDRLELTQVIEAIDITETAAKSIAGVPEWTAH